MLTLYISSGSLPIYYDVVVCSTVRIISGVYHPCTANSIVDLHPEKAPTLCDIEEVPLQVHHNHQAFTKYPFLWTLMTDFQTNVSPFYRVDRHVQTSKSPDLLIRLAAPSNELRLFYYSLSFIGTLSSLHSLCSSQPPVIPNCYLFPISSFSSVVLEARPRVFYIQIFPFGLTGRSADRGLPYIIMAISLPVEVLTEILTYALAVHPIPADILCAQSLFRDIGLQILHQNLCFRSSLQLHRFISCPSLACAPLTLTLDIAGGASESVFPSLDSVFTQISLDAACRKDIHGRVMLNGLHLILHSHMRDENLHMVYVALSKAKYVLCLLLCLVSRTHFSSPTKFVWTGPDPPHHFSTAVRSYVYSILAAYPTDTDRS